jgi:hypothetical protein
MVPGPAKCRAYIVGAVFGGRAGERHAGGLVTIEGQSVQTSVGRGRRFFVAGHLRRVASLRITESMGAFRGVKFLTQSIITIMTGDRTIFNRLSMESLADCAPNPFCYEVTIVK